MTIARSNAQIEGSFGLVNLRGQLHINYKLLFITSVMPSTIKQLENSSKKIRALIG